MQLVKNGKTTVTCSDRALVRGSWGREFDPCECYFNLRQALGGERNKTRLSSCFRFYICTIFRAELYSLKNTASLLSVGWDEKWIYFMESIQINIRTQMHSLYV